MRIQLQLKSRAPLRTSIMLAVSLAAMPVAVSAHSETPTDTMMAERLNTLRADVAAQLSISDRYSPELLSSLQQLSEALLSANALDESAQTLEQQIQLVKIDDGLYTAQQLPFIFQQLAILAARQNWNELSDRVQYLTWLLERTETQSPEERLHTMKQTRDWVRLLLLQAPRNQEASYLRQWRALEHAALAIGEEAELDREAMQALIYDAALAELYIALAIVTPGPTSQQLIHDIDGQSLHITRPTTRVITVSDLETIYGARASTVIDRSFNNAMGRHRQLIERVAELYDDGEGSLDESDPEAAAMLQLYLGDSILMRQQYEPRMGTHLSPARGSNATGLAASYYERAWNLLSEAGYDAETLNQHFRCPTPLPLAEFASRLDAVEPACQLQEDGSLLLPAFAATRNGVPGLAYGGIPDHPLIANPEGTTAHITFQVGLNGHADRLQYGESIPDTTSSRIRARDILQAMQFRPALQDGRPTRTENVQMQVLSLEVR